MHTLSVTFNRKQRINLFAVFFCPKMALCHQNVHHFISRKFLWVLMLIINGLMVRF